MYILLAHALLQSTIEYIENEQRRDSTFDEAGIVKQLPAITQLLLSIIEQHNLTEDIKK